MTNPTNPAPADDITLPAMPEGIDRGFAAVLRAYARRAVRADRASPSRADGWMDIASAPKDGTDVILSNGVTVAQGHWLHAEGGITEHRDADGRYIGQDEHDGFDGWIDWSGGMLPEPTLWMPVPAAPGSATVPAAVDVGAAQAETAQAAPVAGRLTAEQWLHEIHKAAMYSGHKNIGVWDQSLANMIATAARQFSITATPGATHGN